MTAGTDFRIRGARSTPAIVARAMKMPGNCHESGDRIPSQSDIPRGSPSTLGS